METKLTKTQQDTVMILNQLITDKYEEQIWNECLSKWSVFEDNHKIRDLLMTLQQRGIELNFSVTLTPYDTNPV